MTINDLIARYHSRLPALATALYLVLIAVLGSAIWNVIAGILEQRTVIAAATDLLARLEGRKPAASGAVAAGEDTPIGSPFLEGPTVTVAGAALLQRMAAAVTKVGGNILSSQVELQGSQSKAGLIGVIASCELEQPALQQLLYDLEAGMPFLFIEQLVVQAPTVSGAGTQEGKMRVLLAAYGQWEGGK